MYGGKGLDIISGGDGPDFADAEEGTYDLVYGDQGADLLYGGSGTGDYIDGGSGTNDYCYEVEFWDGCEFVNL